MAKKLSEQVENVLTPFRASIGELAYPSVVQDVSSMLGRQQITTVEGEWKAGAGLKLAARDQHKMQLPANNPAAHLLWFAIRLNEVSTAGEFKINASVPKACEAWITKKLEEVAA